MNQDPADDRWEGRDRFILSPGHTSLTLYTQLFLGGYGLEMKDLEELRTWGALTPGHPEYKHTKGVEITTGPLGQGLASAVGFAYAQRRMRGMFDPEAAPGTSPFDHHVYVIASEGDVQEGVTAEASALAGHQELGNLIVVWDRNHISIEEDTDVAFTEDVAKRYESYGWDVQRVDWTRTGEYVEDVAELYAAIERAKAVTDKPSFIELRTIIGYPAPHKQNTGAVHGSKLGAEEVAATKEVLGFDPAKSFFIEENVLAHPRQLVIIAELPRNQMGKILRRKVAQLVRDGQVTGIADIRDETSGRTGQRLVTGHPSCSEPLQTQFELGLDDDDKIEQVLHLPLDKERNIVDRHLPGRNRVHPSPRLCCDEGQEELFQARTTQVVGEDQPSQGAAVQGAVRGQDSFPELGHHCRKTVTARADDVTSDLVGTGHDRATLLEQAGHRRLA